MAPKSSVQDTDTATEEILEKLYREMTPEQKTARIVGMWQSMQSLAEAEIRARRPGISTHELKLRVASRRIPRELMIQVFGWDPEQHGF